MAAEQQSMVAGGSRFAAACGRLRQYMMEQGGGGGPVTMGLVPCSQAVAVMATEERTKKTMELFPQQPGTLKDKSHGSRILEADRAQLTIFYGGCTIVFDDFPADKADELMQLASSFHAPVTSSFHAPATSGAEPVGPNVLEQLQPFLSDMPVARKVSLQRFLEKRKNRLAAANPYPVPLVAPAREVKDKGKPVEVAPWLAVNSRLHLN